MKSTNLLVLAAFAALSTAAVAQPAVPPAPAVPAAPNADKPASAADRMRDRMKARAAELQKAPAEVRKAASLGTITFEGNKVGPKNPAHKGEFTDWHFTRIDIPGGDITKGTIEASINLLSLKTDADKLTGHLKSADFFDMDKFPTATVTITNAVPTTKDDEGQHYEAQGTVTIKGVSQPVKIAFVKLSDMPLRVKGSATVERSRFGVGVEKYSEANSTIAEAVPVHFDLVVPDKIAQIEGKISDAVRAAEAGVKKVEGEAAKAAEGAEKAAGEAAKNAGATAPADTSRRPRAQAID